MKERGRKSGKQRQSLLGQGEVNHSFFQLLAAARQTASISLDEKAKGRYHSPETRLERWGPPNKSNLALFRGIGGNGWTGWERSQGITEATHRSGRKRGSAVVSRPRDPATQGYRSLAEFEPIAFGLTSGFNKAYGHFMQRPFWGSLSVFRSFSSLSLTQERQDRDNVSSGA
jgi:hypothetical protein